MTGPDYGAVLVSKDEDQGYVTRVTRSSGSNFYYSFLFLPRPQRQAIHAIYAFCREVDDSVDGASDSVTAARQVAFWRRELAACYEGTPTHPISRSLAAHLRTYPIRRNDLEEIIAGVEMDVTPRRYESYAELRRYCHRVASAVGLVCIEVFGYTEPSARDYAIALGHAFQMTNILRDVRPDAERGRIYLPADEMEQFGCRPEDLRAGAPTPAFHAFIRHQTRRARELFDEAHRLFPTVDRSTLFAAEIMGAIYESILGRIERRPGSVLAGRIRIPRSRKLLIAVSCYLRSLAARRRA